MSEQPTEHAIQLQIMEYLALKGIYAWRNNSGTLRDRRGIPVRFGKVGSADILGVAPDGKFLAIEVKRPGGSWGVQPAQEAFLQEITRRGGYAGVATCLEDVDSILGA